jgi:DNA-binding beta-propeller fold protein YncE
MKTLWSYLARGLIVVVSVSCGTSAVNSTPMPAENSPVPQIEPSATEKPPTPPTVTALTTTSLSVEFVWSFNGGETPFFYPSGIAIDSQGNLYVADTRNQRIVKIDPNGQFLAQWGSAGDGTGQFVSPTGVAVDEEDHVYVTEAGYDRVQKFDSEGTFLAQWGGSGSRDPAGYPTNLAVDGQGNLFITDHKNIRIKKLGSAGEFLTEWGGQGTQEGQFSAIGSVAVDAEGNVFVNDLENNQVTITKFNNNGNFLTKWRELTCEFPREAAAPAQIGGAGGMWVDLQGNLYVADLAQGRICRFDQSGTFVGGWGEKGLEPGQLLAPTDIVGDNTGSLYVLDYSSGQVQKFQLK